MNYMRYSAQSGMTDTDILDIRNLVADENKSFTEVADIYGINRRTVSRIVNNTYWSHVPQPTTLSKLPNYVIYPDGRVYSKHTNKFLSTESRNGSTVNVKIKGKRYNVAELVANAFINRKLDSSKIGFVNGDPTDVHFTNLKLTK